MSGHKATTKGSIHYANSTSCCTKTSLNSSISRRARCSKYLISFCNNHILLYILNSWLGRRSENNKDNVRMVVMAKQ